MITKTIFKNLSPINNTNTRNDPRWYGYVRCPQQEEGNIGAEEIRQQFIKI